MCPHCIPSYTVLFTLQYNKYMYTGFQPFVAAAR